MQFEAPHERVLGRSLQRFLCISSMAVRVAISDIVRGARIDGLLVRCAGIDGFLMLNVSKSYEQHSVRMQELEIG